MTFSNRGPMGQRRPKAKPEPAYLAKVRTLPRVICEAFGEPQLSPTTAHHPIHDRHEQRKRPDATAIPLCDGHHQAFWDRSKISIHEEPNEWRDRYGADHEYIEVTQDRLGR